MQKMTALEIEIALAYKFHYRTNTIVPNVSWGAGIHECDLLMVTRSKYAWEIEIKVTKHDLMRDSHKAHAHDHEKIKYLLFAIPDYLYQFKYAIPAHSGIIVMSRDNRTRGLNAQIMRKPEARGRYQWNENEINDLHRLASLRIWSLKEHIQRVKDRDKKI